MFESMRYKGETAVGKTLWINEAIQWGELDGRIVLLETALTWYDDGSPWASFTVEELVYNADERIMFSIETLVGELVGGINIHSMQPRHGTFETGTRLYRQFRGLGYAFEAKRILLRYAFHELRYQKYNIRCIEINEAMIRHAQRLGCQEEGRIRRHIYTNGRYYDELIFGLTREEFDKLTDS